MSGNLESLSAFARLNGRCRMKGHGMHPVLAVAAVIVAAEPAVAQAALLTRASVADMSTAQLAQLLLPGPIARTIDAHEVRSPALMAQGPLSSIVLFARAEMTTATICRRRSYHVTFNPVFENSAVALGWDVPSKPDQVTPGVLVATAPSCASASPDGFARVQPASLEAGAVAALDRLVGIQAQARQEKRPPVALTCRSELATDACAEGAHAVLVQMPLHKSYIIDQRHGRGDRWQFSVMPKGPGQLYWVVDLDASPRASTITMTWSSPPPF